MTTTKANPVSVLEQDFGARPTVWVIRGLYVWPAYLIERPNDGWGMTTVLFHHVAESNDDLPFHPMPDRVPCSDVKDTEEEALRTILRDALRTVESITAKLTGVKA
jgi:hypothetical protein